MSSPLLIFISYRRGLSGGHAGRLNDTLTAQFGDEAVFMDREIAPGTQWSDVIDRTLDSCDVLIAVIGTGWVEAADDEGRRRLDESSDVLRREIEAALSRGIPVIPVRVGGAPLPEAQDLPGALAKLRDAEDIELTDGGWKDDAQPLIDAIVRIREEKKSRLAEERRTQVREARARQAPAEGATEAPRAPAAPGTEVAVLRGHEYQVFCASYSPDGARIVTGSDDETARVWRATGGPSLLVLRGHEDELHTVSFSPDGLRVLTGSDDFTARVWDAATGSELLILRATNPIGSASYAPDGRTILTVSEALRLWDAESGSELLVLEDEDGFSDASFSPDASRIVSVSRYRLGRIWDARDGSLLLVFPTKDMVARWDPSDGKSWESPENSACYSPDGDRILTATYSGAVAWDATTGIPLMVIIGHTEGVNQASFSPDGTRIATASGDGTVRVWDATDQTERLVLSEGSAILVLRHDAFVYSARFSPDGTEIVTACAEETARVWQAG